MELEKRIEQLKEKISEISDQYLSLKKELDESKTYVQMLTSMVVDGDRTIPVVINMILTLGIIIKLISQ